MPFRVKACTMFSAAHRIEGHPRCGRIHGHNYRVCIVLREDKPMGIDLDELEEWLQEHVFKRFDHQYLNKLLAEDGELPTVTSEDLAQMIASWLEKSYPGMVELVEVCETPQLCVEYIP
ncbi:6-pyruvoyl trahydropterin synthase family protein [Pyrodictium delaneyi]|uniref:6-pyruvoyl trahydropterin synthase family protein n=1 Tax=Pyrodictium delaneyi TaxID=1273541 RepID=UPI0006DC1515|nr:6-pyruvoyl tetrahydropterin synthase family protein [Pyrodictium delaneyi]